MKSYYAVNGISVVGEYGMLTVPALVDRGGGILELIDFCFSIKNGLICDAFSDEPMSIRPWGSLAGWGDLDCDHSYLIDGSVRVSGPLLEKLLEVIDCEIQLPRSSAESE